MDKPADIRAIEISEDAQFYRDLLVKYMHLVLCCEGIDYIEHIDFEKEVKISDREREELEAIAESVRLLRH